MHDYSDLRRILFEVLVIVALGVVVGLSANLKLIDQVLQGKAPLQQTTRDPGLATPAETTPQPIDLESLRQGIAQKTLLPVDARISELYAEGHLPAAVSLPLDEVATRLQDFRLQVSTEQSLAIYCNGYGCPDSFDLAVKLIAAGYRDVQVYEGGFPEWQDAGLPIEEGGKP